MPYQKLTKNEKVEEKLKDRRDYRQSLINRREGIDKKILDTEAEIKALRGNPVPAPKIRD